MATNTPFPSRIAGCLALVTLGMALGCGGSSTASASSPSSSATKRADFGVDSYLPLEGDTVLSFETEVEGSADRGLLVMQIRRPRPDLAELRIGSKTHRLDVTKEGVRVVEGGWLLRFPIEVGATFPGQYGSVRVTRVGLTVEVPAGRFEGCIETEETSGTTRTLTQYCPTVGIVQLEIESLSSDAPGREVARLKFYGPLLDLGEDRVKVTQ